MNRNIPLVFSMLLLAGIIVPAYAQTIESVVINEVDINPNGSDFASISEYVELYNPTDSAIDIGGWKVASTVALKKTMILPSGTIIQPGQFITFSYQSAWFADAGESVELRDKDNVVIDKTPLLYDSQDDFASHQRIYDGVDTDSPDDWELVMSTPGTSNGILEKALEEKTIVVTVSPDKPFYLFNEYAIISGSVSEQVFIEKPTFQLAPLIMEINGPDYFKTLTLFPDRDLNFGTTIKLQQVLGVNPGTYDISVNYAGTTSFASYSVGFELIEQEIIPEREFGVSVDKPQYIPGEEVIVTAFTSGTTPYAELVSKTIPYTGIKFSVTDSGGTVIASGNLFPNSSDKFLTAVYLDNINPKYGTYTVVAEYFDKSDSTTFEVIEDFKEDTRISLWVDKDAYGLGDQVLITGRLNQVHVDTLNLDIVQTTQTGLTEKNVRSDAGFRIKDGVTIMGDGSFSYSFKIPDIVNRIGAYKITMSENVGTATLIFPVVDDPENFTAPTDPLTVWTDMEIYGFGDSMKISGFVKDPYSNTSYQTGQGVKLYISHEDGRSLEIVAKGKNAARLSTSGQVIGYDFTAVPETSGLYSVSVDIAQNLFVPGNYVIRSEYGSIYTTTTFSVVDLLDLSDGAIVSIDKEIYGLGETVYLTGVIPPTGDNSVKISVTRPDGTRTDQGATVDNQRFTWSWDVPKFEKPQKIDNVKDLERDRERLSNYGVYKIRVSTASEGVNIFFKVSADPENDSLEIAPLTMSTEESLYQVGERVQITGSVIVPDKGTGGTWTPDRVEVKVLDGTFPYRLIPGYVSTVYPDQGGSFVTIFDLPITIFKEGPYTIQTSYGNHRVESTIGVANDYVLNLNEPVTLLLTTDKSEYFPGETVTVNGKPNKLVYIKKINVGVIQNRDSTIVCATTHCGEPVGKLASYLPGPDGSFTHQFVIPDTTSSKGTYEVSADVGFDIKYVKFNVVGETPTVKSTTLIHKMNRIPDDSIQVFTIGTTVDKVDYNPRVLSGSLVTPSRDEYSNVNLKVSLPPTTILKNTVVSPEDAAGRCIIGPDPSCVVKQSTRKPGQIYELVTIKGIPLNVRYSGPDAAIEKFSIVPVNSEFLPDTRWNVEVLKDDQVSRFYYKITYKTSSSSLN